MLTFQAKIKDLSIINNKFRNLKNFIKNNNKYKNIERVCEFNIFLRIKKFNFCSAHPPFPSVNFFTYLHYK